MSFPKSVKQLCTPAYIYLLLSVIGIIMAIVQNLGNRRMYTLGSMNVPVSSTVMVFVVKIVGILFYTWILNLMCKDGHKEIAWFLVLLPFALLFFAVGTVEGFQSAPPICSEQTKCDSALADMNLCKSEKCAGNVGSPGCPPQDRCSQAISQANDCSNCPKQ